MMTKPLAADEEMPSLLDSLVCDELDETARGRVVTWLEEDPVRWRQCGLAFLEAQAWSQALADWPRTSAGRGPTPAVEQLSVPEESRRRRPALRRILAGLALCIAFGLGLAMRDVVVPRRPTVEQPVARQVPRAVHDQVSNGGTPGAISGPEPVLAAFDVQSGSRSGPTAPIRIPVVPAGSGLSQDAPHATEIPDYLRKQWERRGYKVSFERRYLFARLPDGRQIVVPVEQLNVNPTRVQIN
jgi:hypothetical protein